MRVRFTYTKSNLNLEKELMTESVLQQICKQDSTIIPI